MSKFQIGDFAKSVGAAVSKLDTSEQLQYLDIDLLDANEANFYELSNLQPLADSIAMDGLQQPLVVTPEENGRYKVLSGHRRRAAIRLLLEESEDPLPKLRSVPCLVRRYKSQHLAELQLILANSTARELTSAEKMRQAERIEMLLYQLKEEGYQFPGRMRDQVAAACNVSAPKLARLKVIREHLIPEYMVAFEANRLPEQTAYALARMQDDFQARLYRVLKGDAPNGRRAEELLQLQQEGCAWEPILTCPNGKPCQRGDAFLRHDAECLTHELCKGGDMLPPMSQSNHTIWRLRADVRESQESSQGWKGRSQGAGGGRRSETPATVSGGDSGQCRSAAESGGGGRPEGAGYAPDQGLPTFGFGKGTAIVCIRRLSGTLLLWE